MKGAAFLLVIPRTKSEGSLASLGMTGEKFTPI